MSRPAARIAGRPGRDRFDWPRFVAALRSEPAIGVRSASSRSRPHNDAIARAASIWRPLAESPDQLAIDGLAFLRGALRDIPVSVS